jgi:hypothetical protein
MHRPIKILHVSLALLLLALPLQAGTHIQSTFVQDGVFYPDASKGGVFYFESKYAKTERYDISLMAVLTASGVYSPEIPGLRLLYPSGNVKNNEMDAEAIALVKKHGGHVFIFRTADDDLFYVNWSGKTPARKITIKSEQGDEVILWRNLPKVSK